MITWCIVDSQLVMVSHLHFPHPWCTIIIITNIIITITIVYNCPKVWIQSRNRTFCRIRGTDGTRMKRSHPSSSRLINMKIGSKKKLKLGSCISSIHSFFTHSFLTWVFSVFPLHAPFSPPLLSSFSLPLIFYSHDFYDSSDDTLSQFLCLSTHFVKWDSCTLCSWVISLEFATCQTWTWSSLSSGSRKEVREGNRPSELVLFYQTDWIRREMMMRDNVKLTLVSKFGLLFQKNRFPDPSYRLILCR